MRLKQLRKENRLRQADVAKVLNVTPEAYSMWESGARQMSLNNLVALSRFYGVSLAYLAGVSEERRVGGGLSADENALLDWFSRLDEADRGLLLSLARNLAGNKKYEK